MEIFDKYFVEVRNGSKVTYSAADLSKLDKMYEAEALKKMEKKLFSPIKKERQKSFGSQVRDYAFERILDRRLYTFKYLLVIPNPYGVAKQTALILFNSSKAFKVRYRVVGNRPGCDFEGESIYSTRHRVPIMGLYQGRNNSVVLELVDEDGKVVKKRTITIYVSAVGDGLKDVVCRTDDEETRFPFILLNGVNYNPIVIDGEGQIRYSLQCKTGRLGMMPLNNGHFLLMDKSANRVDEYGRVQPCRYHEMDYMGRVYRTFLFEYAIGRAMSQNGGSLFLVTSSDADHVLDCVIELDINSGEIIKRCDISTIFGSKYRFESNWADITRLEWRDGALFANVKRLHSIVKLNWEKLEPEWVMAPDGVWTDTPVEKHLLKGGSAAPVFSGPEYMTVVGGEEKDEYEIAVFDTRSVGHVKYAGGRTANRSAASLIRVDEKNRTYSILRREELDKSLRYGSVIYSDDKSRILAAEGILRHRQGECNARLVEIGAADGARLKTTDIKKAFTKAWIFAPSLDDYCRPIDINERTVFGKIKEPEKFDGTLPALSDEKIDSDYFGRVRLCDDLFIFSMEPGMVERIYFIGRKNGYVQDYSNVAPANKRTSFAISLAGLKKDEYGVYVESEGLAYKLKNEIERLH